MIKGLKFIFAVAYIFMLAGCYPGIKGKVVDSVTGTPIQGAIVVAEWTTTGGGAGLSYSRTYKIVETETDHTGTFKLSGIYNPMVGDPTMIIYKTGYAPWRNDIDFKASAILHNKVIWQDNLTYRLDPWREELSKELLRIHLTYRLAGANNLSTPRFSKMKRDAE